MSARRESLKLLRELAAAAQALDVSSLDELLCQQQNDGDGSLTEESFRTARAAADMVVALKRQVQVAIDEAEATEVTRRRKRP